MPYLYVFILLINFSQLRCIPFIGLLISFSVKFHILFIISSGFVTMFINDNYFKCFSRFKTMF